MKLKTLLKNFPGSLVKGNKEVEITGITSNSKKVSPGNLFIVKKGLTYDGAEFINEAIANGAVAILTDMYDPFLNEIAQIVHPDTRLLEEELAKRFYQNAADKLLLIGVTGTNGKTTCTYLIKHLLDAINFNSGLIGTIEWIVGANHFPSLLTTPDFLTNQKLFYEMVESGCKAAVMEVSSHALDQGRVRGLDFEIGVFTNLTQDHLDYHETLEKYAEAKSLLFSHCKVAVINADSPYANLMLKKCQNKVITYGIESDADVKASSLKLTAQGAIFDVNYLGKCVRFKSALIGRFNVYNALACITTLLAKSVDLNQIASSLSSFKRVKGRLEPIANNKGFHVFVDFAHTDDALLNVLQTLKEIKKGRLITVFGCGGDRDQSKRSKMGSVAEEFSDLAIITSDNPRTEDPYNIIKQILSGIKNPGNVIVEPDRKQAIYKALSLAKKEDILLVAGKGHENYQILAKGKIPFDDREILYEALI